MRVIRASILGYCLGVRRAVTLAYKELQAGKVYTLGPLIHNPQVLEELRSRGGEIVEEGNLPSNLQGKVVILRAHGITPALEGELLSRGARLADATCPKVKANQLKARNLTAAGYCIFLAGEKQHSEVIGIQGYAPDCFMVSNPREARDSAARLSRENPGAKTALLGQTTLSPEEYQDIGGEIQQYFPALEILDTICQATKDRQDALKELCKQADALVIAGGKSSANTRRLLAIAQAQGKPAWLVESLEDLPREGMTYSTIGLSAGASTPDTLIDQIESALHKGGLGGLDPPMGVWG